MNRRPSKIRSLHTYGVLWIHWCVANCIMRRDQWKSAFIIRGSTNVVARYMVRKPGKNRILEFHYSSRFVWWAVVKYIHILSRIEKRSHPLSKASFALFFLWPKISTPLPNLLKRLLQERLKNNFKSNFDKSKWAEKTKESYFIFFSSSTVIRLRFFFIQDAKGKLSV